MQPSKRTLGKTGGDYKILKGHKKIGATFTNFPDMLTETSYVEETLPELIWIAVLNDSLGEETTARILEIIAEAIPEKEEQTWFVFSSRLAKLGSADVILIRERLRIQGLLESIQQSLSPFVYLYPAFPVRWFEVLPSDQPDYLQRYKILLKSLLDKTSRASTLMLANATYGSMIAGDIVFPPTSVMADLNAVLDYPKTERSKIVASSLRSSMLTIIRFAVPKGPETNWCHRFWQRGIELEPVDYHNLLRGVTEFDAE
jgi:hypothetical protein